MVLVPKYISGDACEVRQGDVGFLIERSSRGAERWTLSYTPAHTNQSHEPRLHGWCGETNNVSVYARGLARHVATGNPHNGRIRIEPLTDATEIARALEVLAYPELAE